jgi:hypothetical protein
MANIRQSKGCAKQKLLNKKHNIFHVNQRTKILIKKYLNFCHKTVMLQIGDLTKFNRTI